MLSSRVALWKVPHRLVRAVAYFRKRQYREITTAEGAEIDKKQPLRAKLDQALLSLGRLDSLSSLHPDAHLLPYMFMRKEAVLSCQLDGTVSTLTDLLLFEAGEAPASPISDVVQVFSHVAAMEHGLAQVRQGHPVNDRLIREIEGILFAQQNGVILSAARDLHQLGEADQHFPDLGILTPACRTLSEVQDPNLESRPTGRLARLLTSLSLCSGGILSEPLLYLSKYLKENQRTYDQFRDQTGSGSWRERPQAFFTEGVLDSAHEARRLAQNLSIVAAVDRERVQVIGRGTNELAVLQYLKTRPVTSATQLATNVQVSFATAGKILGAFQEAGIMKLLGSRKRNRVFIYTNWLGALDAEGEHITRNM